MQGDAVDLFVRLDEARDAAVARHGVWVYVSVDRESGEMVNAAGFWESEADALLAAATDDDPGSDHRPLPLFVRNPLDLSGRRA